MEVEREAVVSLISQLRGDMDRMADMPEEALRYIKIDLNAFEAVYLKKEPAGKADSNNEDKEIIT